MNETAPPTPQTPPLPAERSPDKVRRDAITVIVMSVAAAVAVVLLAVNRALELFVPGGIAWKLPVEPQAGTAEGLSIYGADGPIPAEPVSGTFTELHVVVPDVNAVSTACLAISIVVAALGALVVIASTARVAWLLLRGRFLTTQTSFALRVLTWSLLLGGLLTYALWHLGSNGIRGALEVRADASGSMEWWGWYWIVLFALVSLGLIDIGLRRAIRLQRETEGLV